MSCGEPDARERARPVRRAAARRPPAARLTRRLAVDPYQPWITTLNISARSVRVLSDRRATPQLRISCRSRVFASPETAGEKFTKVLPEPTLRQPRTERVAKEVKRRVLV